MLCCKFRKRRGLFGEGLGDFGDFLFVIILGFVLLRLLSLIAKWRIYLLCFEETWKHNRNTLQSYYLFSYYFDWFLQENPKAKTTSPTHIKNGYPYIFKIGCLKRSLIILNGAVINNTLDILPREIILLHKFIVGKEMDTNLV